MPRHENTAMSVLVLSPGGRGGRKVHVVLAAVGSHDSRDLVRQAGTEVVDVAFVDVQALVIARHELEREIPRRCAASRIRTRHTRRSESP